MKLNLTVAALGALVVAGALSSSAQAQLQFQVPGAGVTIGQPAPVPNYGSGPPPGRCEELRDREHEMRRQVDFMPYGPERSRMERRIGEIHAERERCGHR